MAAHVVDGPVTILFTDVVDSTSLHAAQGDEKAQEILRACEDVVRGELPAFGGRPIKSLGDGLMVAFTSPRKALTCALAVQDALAAHRDRHPELAASVRIGIHTGEATELEGDLLGTAVNAAARICAKAGGDEILTSDVVRQMCGTMADIRFAERGRLVLRGFPERWRLFRVLHLDAGSDAVLPARALVPFVGRESQRREFAALLQQLQRGRGGLVMVGGEPGVGKTRLSQEVVAEARRRGFRAFTGHSHEGEGLPYMPWVEILEAAARETTPAALRRELREAAPELARIVPQLKRIFPHLAPPLELPSEQQRRHLFNVMRDYISRVAGIRPHVLVLEDLHWADGSTLRLLEHLADALPGMSALVVATYRDAEVSPNLAESLSTLVRQRQVHLITLQRHSEDEVSKLLTALSGRPAPRSVAAAIHAETDGNAFFVEEVFRHLSKSGRLLDDEGDFRDDLRSEDFEVPANVLLVTGRRLERLGDTTRRVLTVGAVIGRHFRFELLEAVAEIEERELLDAIDEAEAAQLLMTVSSGREVELWFAHELIRQSLLATLSRPRRQRLHLRVADALEDDVRGVDINAADIAHHLTQAGGASDPARAARYLMLAGDRAQGVAAFEEALRNFGEALELLPETEARSRADVLVKLGRTQQSLSRWDEAVATWQSALTALEELGDVDAIVALCWEFCTHLAWAHELPSVLEVARRGLVAAGPRPTRQRARMLGMVGLAQSLLGDFAAASAHLGEANEIAATCADPQLVGDIGLPNMAHNFNYLRLSEIVTASRPTTAGLREAGDQWHLAEALAFLDIALVFQGRFCASDDVHRELEPLAERLGQWAAAGIARRNSFASASARVADLDRLEALEAPSPAGPARRGRRVRRPRGIVQFWRGDWAEARRQMEEGVRRAVPGFWFGLDHGFLFMLLAFSGERTQAYALLNDAFDALPKPGVANTLGAWTLAILAAESVGCLDDVDLAKSLYPMVVEALATGMVMRQYDGRLVQTAAGIAAATAGRADEAEEHFEVALRQAEELPHRLERPHVRHFAARFLARRAGRGDLARARELLGEALSGYRDIGMPRHEAMARALLLTLR